MPNKYVEILGASPEYISEYDRLCEQADARERLLARQGIEPSDVSLSQHYAMARHHLIQLGRKHGRSAMMAVHNEALAELNHPPPKGNLP